MDDLERARSGDRAAFERAVAPHVDAVGEIVRRELGRRLAARVEAGDLVQETWLRAFRSVRSFRGTSPGELAAWLGRIARRVVRDAGRREGAKGRDPAREEPLASEPGAGAGPSVATPSRALRRAERLDRLREALRELSQDHRRVIELVRLEGRPVKEAARELGRSPNATSMLLLRALLSLRERFGDTESLALPDPDPGASTGEPGGSTEGVDP